MHKLRIFGIFAALALLIAACGGPTTPPGTHTLTVDVSGDGNVYFDEVGGDNAEGTNSIAAGAEVKLVANPGTDQKFDGWTGDVCVGEGATCTFSMDGDKSVKANFVALTEDDATLIVNATGDGDVKLGSASGDSVLGSNAFPVGTEVTLVATPAPGNQFESWTGEPCVGEGATCTFEISGDTTVSATFVALPALVNLEVVIEGDAAGTVEQADLGINCVYDGEGTTSGTCTAADMPSTTATTFTATPDGSASVEWPSVPACNKGDTTCDVTPDDEDFVLTVRFTDVMTRAVATGPDDGFEWLTDANNVNDPDEPHPENAAGYAHNSLTYSGMGYIKRYEAEVANGFIFRDLDIPAGAEITSAYIQFTSIARTGSPSENYLPGEGTPELLISAEANADPAPIPSDDGSEAPTEPITSRNYVGATQTWSPPAWDQKGVAGPEQRTPDLSALLSEVVQLAGWDETGDVMFKVEYTGTGPAASNYRAISMFEQTGNAAVLHYTYTLP